MGHAVGWCRGGDAAVRDLIRMEQIGRVIAEGDRLISSEKYLDCQEILGIHHNISLSDCANLSSRAQLFHCSYGKKAQLSPSGVAFLSLRCGEKTKNVQY